MLSSFSIDRFKSYQGATLKLAPLTALIGANAAGKSNAVEALRLLSWIAAGDRLESIRHALQDDRGIRGNVSNLARREESVFRLSCSTTAAEWNLYSISIEVRDEGDLHITDEWLTGGGMTSHAPLFEVVTPSTGSSGDLQVAYNNFARGKKPQIRCNDQTAVLCQLMSSARFYGHHTKAQQAIPAATGRLHRELSSITFLDPRPSLMRGYSFKTDQHLAESGRNLSGVLYNLWQKQENRAELLEFVRALPEQDITEIGFIETPRGDVMVTLTETFGGGSTQYDASLLSDGTLRVLAIAAAMLSAPGSVVVIEEIDNGVHPSRAGQLLRQVSHLAKERNLRVLISSHNPALLDALPDDAVPHVVFCYRSPQDGSSRLVRLTDLPDYPELVAQGSIGHLMTRGLIERFAKERPDPEHRRRRAREWLKDVWEQTG